ncbi:hypothetical protein CYY_006768 [Polysphondylium violaceum]|uniref:Pseudouridine synthase RsuA/RluA-like domain-containing protein n=1 Tax=Polysphondylium violaceum TaxID=133409 RepID=A0A8J4URB2_9MYCE|nr:hypothetical protein CYY_006768 [Polysphondylium violaceum]
MNALIKQPKIVRALYIITQRKDYISNILLDHFQHRACRNHIDQLFKDGAIYFREPLSTFKCVPPLPRRLLNDYVADEGTLLKFFYSPRIHSTSHLKPRFKDYILFENERFMIVDKPHSINLSSTVDSLSNNFTYILKQQLNSPTLYNPHLIDFPTRGLVMLIKDLEYLRRVNEMFKSREGLKKMYKVFVPILDSHKSNNAHRKELKVGVLRQFMKKSPTSPKIMIDYEPSKQEIHDNFLKNGVQDTWKECLLDIKNIETREIAVPLDANFHFDLLAQPRYDPHMMGRGVYRKRHKVLLFQVLDIELITGRTHQIRAQLSSLGHPILSDHLYGGKTLQQLIHNDPTLHDPNRSKSIGLYSFKFSFTCPFTLHPYTFQLQDNYTSTNK